MDKAASRQTEVLAEKVASALQILYLSVKERKMREMLNEIKDGEKNGKYKRVQN